MIAASFGRCTTEFERLQLLETNGLSLTKKQTVNRRSKLGKLVQDLLDSEQNECTSADDHSDSDELETSIGKIIPKLKREELPELSNIPNDKPIDETIIQMVEAYTECLYSFYDELLNKPAQMVKKMEKASVETNLDVLQVVFQEFKEPHFDPMPLNPKWTPYEQNGFFLPWKPKILKVAGKSVFSSSVFINPPFSFISNYELCILKAFLANNIWKTKVIVLLPTPDFESLDQQLILKCCKECSSFTQKDLGRRQFKGYTGLSPFNITLLIWK